MEMRFREQEKKNIIHKVFNLYFRNNKPKNYQKQDNNNYNRNSNK